MSTPARIKLPSTLLGQSLALSLLTAALTKERLSTAYCFSGPEGVGRALTASWFAQAILCTESPQPCGQCSNCHLSLHRSHPDLLWVEPTHLHQGRLLTVAEAREAQVQRRALPQIRLEQVQAIGRFTARAPLRSYRSVVIMEGAETLAETAANALLKTLEEPGHALLILLTQSSTRLLPTIVSRCQLIPFVRLSQTELVQILNAQGYRDVPSLLLSMAQGSPGAAITALQQWQEIPAELLMQLQTWPASLSQALSLGRQIARALDVPQQLWLVDYLQHHYWSQGDGTAVHHLESIRRQLLTYVQPQLVWEVNLSRDL